jgi:hypothetical protein
MKSGKDNTRPVDNDGSSRRLHAGDAGVSRWTR